MPEFDQTIDGNMIFETDSLVTTICPMQEEETPSKYLCQQFCSTLPFGTGVGVRTVSEDDKKFIVVGPLKPLTGYALSNFFNREFFGLDPVWSDLFIAQTRQREITKENSFVVESHGELVYLRVDDPEHCDGMFEFIKQRHDDIKFVLENPKIDRFLRDRSFRDAKASLEIMWSPSLAQ